jgi:hypothetical protein
MPANKPMLHLNLLSIIKKRIPPERQKGQFIQEENKHYVSFRRKRNTVCHSGGNLFKVSNGIKN